MSRIRQRFERRWRAAEKERGLLLCAMGLCAARWGYMAAVEAHAPGYLFFAAAGLVLAALGARTMFRARRAARQR
jgi:hypothetical protein